MAHIVVLGAGIGGLPCAYELRSKLSADHRITVVNEREYFQFVPSNPWVAVGWRDRESTTFEIRPCLERKGINFVAKRCGVVDAGANRLMLEDESTIDYDYLVIATGPRQAFDEVDGAGPNGCNTHSVCTVDQAERTYRNYKRFLQDPGHVVIGALPFASCFGPAYEYAFILDADLRKRRLRDDVPITFVTPEPYIGHFGLGGVGDSRSFLESDLRAHHVNWIANAKVVKVEPARMLVEQYNDAGKKIKDHELELKFSMVMPSFRGVDCVAKVEGLCDSRGFVFVDGHQRSPKFRNIFSAGVCIAVPPVEATAVPTDVPKTGYMIESMVTAIVRNISDEITGQEGTARATWNAICLADMGDTGAAFVAMPQIPPRSLAWFKKGKWVHMAKIAFEKYFIRKMKKGTSEPVYEKYLLKMLGIGKLK
jgi:sulfide:quinone oxidoreductase